MKGDTHSGIFVVAMPAVVVVILAAAFMYAWLFLFRRVRNDVGGAKGFLAILSRWIVGTLAIWFTFQTVSLALILATPWPLFLLSMLGSAALEALAFLYKFERSATKADTGRAIFRLRLAAIFLVLLILSEPVIKRVIVRKFERQVVILLDQSASMNLTDPQRDVDELMELAAFYGIIDLDHKDYAEKPKNIESFISGLSTEKKEKILSLRDKTRREIARHLVFGNDGKAGLRDELARNYDVRLIDFAASPRTNESGNADKAAEGDSDWEKLSNISAALGFALENIPTEQLAGVVLISDCRDTARGNSEAAAISLGQRSVPVHPVLTGSVHDRLDLAVTNINAPESIYKGEKLSVEADLKFHMAAGREVRVKFMRDNDVLEERTLAVPDDNQHRTMTRFQDEPGEEGIYSYSVGVEQIEGEADLENNVWRFQTAVSDDRTNVLLVDSLPRWEFRYLRNLFFGRDKSVHLQYVLTDPDAIINPDGGSAGESRQPVAASASRTFGEAEADILPDSIEEWRKFDVIIIGDVSPKNLTQQQIEHIEHCVNVRGAALIVIAGPNYMPHKFDGETWRNLLPIVYTATKHHHFVPPEPEFRLQAHPTLEGRHHPVMRIGSDTSDSERIWVELPNLQWRFNAEDIKPGAVILAYAIPQHVEEVEFTTADANPEETLKRIKELTEIQRRNSLIVSQYSGLGRVMMLNFDRTWRLRYRIGDTLHHRFWGRIMTWGAGENLRAGSQFVRLGTNRITYSHEESINVSARVMRPDYTPVTDARVNLDVYRDEKKVAVQRLKYRPQSQGMYDAQIGPFKETGRYRIALSGDAIERIISEENAEPVETEFLVVTAYNQVETAELSVDRDTAGRLAAASGGDVLPLNLAQQLRDAFGPGSKGEPERADITLWDHWILLLVLLCLLTAEWLLRRKGGLP